MTYDDSAPPFQMELGLHHRDVAGHGDGVTGLVRAKRNDDVIRCRIVCGVFEVSPVRASEGVWCGHRGTEGNAEPLVGSFPYAARSTVAFMIASNSMGASFPRLCTDVRRCVLAEGVGFEPDKRASAASSLYKNTAF